jgi:hypothetical protein
VAKGDGHESRLALLEREILLLGDENEQAEVLRQYIRQTWSASPYSGMSHYLASKVEIVWFTGALSVIGLPTGTRFGNKARGD